MKRGEIFLADLNPTVGAETNKKRPVLIVSNDANNRAASVLTIVPITSNVAKIFPFDVLLKPDTTGLKKPSKAQANQIRTISKERIIGKRLGKVDIDVEAKLNAALRLHLAL